MAWRAASTVDAEAPMNRRSPATRRAPAIDRSSGPRWTPSASLSSAMSTWSLTTKSASVTRPRSVRASSSSSPRGIVLCRNWMTSAPPRWAAVAMSMTRSGEASGVITYSSACQIGPTRPASPGDLPGERGGEDPTGPAPPGDLPGKRGGEGPTGSAPPGDLPGERGGEVTLPSAQDFAQFFSEGFWGLVAIARILDQALEVLLEFVMVHAVGTPFEVKLHLERFRIGQLAVDEAVELARTLFTSHCCGTCCMPSAWTIPESTAYS